MKLTEVPRVGSAENPIGHIDQDTEAVGVRKNATPSCQRPVATRKPVPSASDQEARKCVMGLIRRTILRRNPPDASTDSGVAMSQDPCRAPSICRRRGRRCGAILGRRLLRPAGRHLSRADGATSVDFQRTPNQSKLCGARRPPRSLVLAAYRRWSETRAAASIHSRKRGAGSTTRGSSSPRTCCRLCRITRRVSGLRPVGGRPCEASIRAAVLAAYDWAKERAGSRLPPDRSVRSITRWGRRVHPGCQSPGGGVDPRIVVHECACLRKTIPGSRLPDPGPVRQPRRPQVVSRTFARASRKPRPNHSGRARSPSSRCGSGAEFELLECGHNDCPGHGRRS